ncbi:MAG TPA: MarR family transcriptional regulator [Acidimicrobiia bacterium]
MLTTASTADRLRVAVGRLARKLRQQSLGGLTPSQASVLSTLDRHGPMAMSQVAGHERISKPSATGIVGRLVDKGFVARSPDADDRRSFIVEISPAGRELIDRRRRERTAYLARRIDSLSEEDHQALERAIELFENMIEEK